jgi:hypothetical protein
LAATVAGCSPARVCAQAGLVFAPETAWTGFRDVHHRDECRLAHQILTLGQPANKREWALDRIGTCGPEGGEALATQFQAKRLANDDTPELEDLVIAARDFVDGNLYRAALGIASDGTAGTAARVDAIRIIFGMLRPGTRATYEEFADAETTITGAFTVQPTYGTPLPTTAAEDARKAMQDVRRTAQTEAVRNAAGKLFVAASVSARPH